jgi:hypothetical protein
VAKHAPLTASATDHPSNWEDVADLLDSLSFALTQLEANFAGDHDLKKIGLGRFGKGKHARQGVQSGVMEIAMKCHGTKPRPPP